MRYAGIDIGSRSLEVVVIENGAVVHEDIRENSFNPLDAARAMMEQVSFDRIAATGYGRHLFANHFRCDVISEIKAYAIGARYLMPSCRTILDIGGQDTKAIALDDDGRIRKFEMNDKCAAGTGKFLEIMAMALGFTLSEFGEEALRATQQENINSMCTVFAESEVISTVARGAPRGAVARGLHYSVIARAATMLQRVGLRDHIAFVGGVALNPCMKVFLEQSLDRPVLTPERPQIVGALGCAAFSMSQDGGGG